MSFLSKIWEGLQDVLGVYEVNKPWDALTSTLLNFCSCAFQVKVTQSTADHSQPQLIKNLHKGDYFGEKALIRLVHTDS